MKISVYTSCAMNYYAKARALSYSIKKNSPNTSLTLCLCDEPNRHFQPELHGFARVWMLHDLGYDSAWIFQHNIMELCTGVKGRALVKLMEEDPDADLYIYLDPDVYVYNDLSIVMEYLEGCSIGLVPHMLSPETTDLGVKLHEISVLQHGIFNLGHLIIRNDDIGKSFSEWWAERLDEYCYDDKPMGLFTDQRWIDLVPTIFDSVKILRVPNLDVASWNIGNRKIVQNTKGDERSYVIDGYPLITYHFSGTGPTGTHKKIREIFAPHMSSAAEIERHYENIINDFGQKHLENIPPAYDFFNNGQEIPYKARRIYRLHDDLKAEFKDPYDTSSEYNYIDWIREHYPGLVNGIRIPRHRLDAAFRELFDENYYLSRYPDVWHFIDKGIYKNPLEHYIAIGSANLYDPCEFFVTAYYLEQCSDLPTGRMQAQLRSKEGTFLWHYLTIGLPNAIEPIEFFDSRYYLNSYPDIAIAFRMGYITTPLAHFLHNGAKELRDPSEAFNSQKMLENRPELKEIIQQEHVRGLFGALLKEGFFSGRMGG